jgi:myo-inositol 2-dehydrogenase/D-chiro-inositol 1-dehydrogenase
MPHDQAKIRVAVIGTGGWGWQHARVFSHRADVDFCAVVGRSRDRAQARAAEFGVQAYTDISEMLEREKPDLVSLCLPNQEHFAPTLQVIEAGFPLLVEKPLVFDLAEADRLLTEAGKRNLFFAINFNHRYAKPVQMAYKAIQAGHVGDLIFATWRFGGQGKGGHPYANLIETQCHGFDLLEYLCGPIQALCAEMTDKTGQGFSTMALSLKFQNGAVGSLIGSYDTSYEYPETQRAEISGLSGRLLIEDTVRRYTFHPAGSEVGETWQAGYFNDSDRAFQHTFDAYTDALLQAYRMGNPPPVRAEAGYRALQLALAAVQSFETGQRVFVS